MPAHVVDRPVWRRFRPRFLRFAAAHVRGGGHAAIHDERGRVEVLLGVDGRGVITELGRWALLSIEQQRWRRVKEGAAAGLATARIRPSYAGSVLDWCERDSIHPGPTRRMALDCVRCAACCHENNVVVQPEDLTRFREASRRDLLGRAYVRRARDGKLTLRMAAGGRCLHLGGDDRCGIYEVRPGPCRDFVVASEACLSAREDTLQIRDGAEPS